MWRASALGDGRFRAQGESGGGRDRGDENVERGAADAIEVASSAIETRHGGESGSSREGVVASSPCGQAYRAAVTTRLQMRHDCVVANKDSVSSRNDASRKP